MKLPLGFRSSSSGAAFQAVRMEPVARRVGHHGQGCPCHCRVLKFPSRMVSVIVVSLPAIEMREKDDHILYLKRLRGRLTRKLGCLTLSCLGLGSLATAASEFSPAPFVYLVHPIGSERGTSRVITVEGINLEDTSKLLFSQQSVKARILEVQETPNKPYRTPRQLVRVELEVGAQVEPGIHGFRLRTPHGTSNWVPFAIGRLRQVDETEPNNSLLEAQAIPLPATVDGSLAKSGAADYFRFQVPAGKELIFEVTADRLGSRLDSVLTLNDEHGRELVRNDNSQPGTSDSFFAYRFKVSGEYYLRIADRADRGGKLFGYRLTLGRLPYLTQVFPLGTQRGTVTRVRVKGHNLDGATEAQLDGHLEADENGVLPLRIQTAFGPTINTLKTSVGTFPELLEQEPNDEITTGQKIEVPTTVNGLVGSPGDRDLFRFRAHQGQVLAFEVTARRLSSFLDSSIEILDHLGNPVPRAVLQALSEDTHDLGLGSRNLPLGRFESTRNTRFYPLDFVLLGGRELVRLERAMRRIDHFSVAQGILGQRLSWLGTTPQIHPRNGSTHKVRILPAGTEVTPGPFPSFSLPFRNDDGGPPYGKDSYLLFTAPREGDYLVSLSDLQNLGGRRYPYRLTIRPASPDYRLFLDDGFILYVDGRTTGARNPNVPRGGSVPLTVSAARIDGFDDPIRVEVRGLPPGLRSTTGTIRVDEFVTTIVLTADNKAPITRRPQPLSVIGHAHIGGTEVLRTASDPREGLPLVTATPAALIRPTVRPGQLTIRPGESVQLEVQIERRGDFLEDVPFVFQNRPAGIYVENSGSSGIVISRGETRRTITLTADPWLKNLSFPMIALGRIKSEAARRRRSGAKDESVDYASEPVVVRIVSSGVVE